MPFGYWEAKDEDDDLNKEIEKKFRRGYPQDNIIFEDSREAVLFQDQPRGHPLPRSMIRIGWRSYSGCSSRNERPEIADFRKAVAQFKTDLPAVLEALRAMIECAEADNPAFRAAAVSFSQARARNDQSQASLRPMYGRC